MNASNFSLGNLNARDSPCHLADPIPHNAHAPDRCCLVFYCTIRRADTQVVLWPFKLLQNKFARGRSVCTKNNSSDKNSPHDTRPLYMPVLAFERSLIWELHRKQAKFAHLCDLCMLLTFHSNMAKHCVCEPEFWADLKVDLGVSIPMWCVFPLCVVSGIYSISAVWQPVSVWSTYFFAALLSFTLVRSG